MKTFSIPPRFPWWHRWTFHFRRRWPFIKVCHCGTCMCEINDILDQI